MERKKTLKSFHWDGNKWWKVNEKVGEPLHCSACRHYKLNFTPRRDSFNPKFANEKRAQMCVAVSRLHMSALSKAYKSSPKWHLHIDSSHRKKHKWNEKCFVSRKKQRHETKQNKAIKLVRERVKVAFRYASMVWAPSLTNKRDARDVEKKQKRNGKSRKGIWLHHGSSDCVCMFTSSSHANLRKKRVSLCFL